MSPLPDSYVLDGFNPRIRTISLENISALAGGSLNDPDVIAVVVRRGRRPHPALHRRGNDARRGGRRGVLHQPERHPAVARRPGDLPFRPGSKARHAGSHHRHHQRHARHPDRAAADPRARRRRRGHRSGVAQLRRLPPASSARTSSPVRMDHGNAGWTLDLDKLAAALDPNGQGRSSSPRPAIRPAR